MKGRKINSFNPFFIAVVLVVLLAAVFSQPHQKGPEKVNIASYDISVQELEKPFKRIDEKGIKRTYAKAYIIRLKGNIDVTGAIPVDIFIGDYKVPEYGGTKDGVYFKIYDDELLKKLEGQPLGYGFQGQKVRTFDIQFRPSTLRPFKSYQLMLPELVPPRPGKEKPDKTSIISYGISVQELVKPFIRIDEEGIKRTYAKAYIIKLKGNIDVTGAIPVDIFIGDYKVPEYGGTKDGVYFKIYDDELLKKLEGQPLGYGFQGHKVRTFDIQFRPSTLKPFKKVDKKQ